MNVRNKSVWYWIGGISCLAVVVLIIYFGQISSSVNPKAPTESPPATPTFTPAIDTVAPGEDGGESVEAAEDSGEDDAPESDYPQFPWPPPQASAKRDITTDIIVNLQKEVIYLGDVNNYLIGLLDTSGYEQRSYFAISDNGFALVTQIEQINRDDGTPLPEPDRFRMELIPREIDTIKDGIAVFSSAPDPGLFRIFVFTITDIPFQSGEPQSMLESVAWLAEGLNVLPFQIAEMEFTDKHNITALIYEFEKPEGGEALLREHNLISAKDHLEKSGILSSGTE